MAESIWPRLLQDRRIAWILGFAIAGLFAIGNLPWQLDDYDQAKQAFTSFQMINDGRWLYQTTPHGWIATKPPLVGWISAALFCVVQCWEVAWRLPSFLAAAAIAVWLFRLSRNAYGDLAAVTAVAAFSLNLLTPRLATLVRTDMPLALVIFAVGTLTWNKIRKSERWRLNDQLLVFALLTAGMLIKGPVVWAFLLPGIIAFEFWRRKVGVSAFCGLWPWIASLGVFLAWVGGGIQFVSGFYEQVVVREFLGRFGGEAHRAQPLLFYFPHLLHKFAPWSVLMIAIALVWLRKLNWKWRDIRISPETCWLICWSIGGLVVMSLLPSKRVDRVFPLVAPLSLLVAAQLSSALSSFRQPNNIYRALAAATVFAFVFTSAYVGWRVSSGYREHRNALAVFGKEVREYARIHQSRYAAVSSRDEGLLLYLRQTAFVPPENAPVRWNAGQIEALVAETTDLPRFADQLKPAANFVLRSGKRSDRDASDYVLMVKP